MPVIIVSLDQASMERVPVASASSALRRRHTTGDPFAKKFTSAEIGGRTIDAEHHSKREGLHRMGNQRR